MIEVYDWPSALMPASQLFRVPGAATDGGFTTGGARVMSPDIGGRAVLDWTFNAQQHPSAQRLFSWLVSKVGSGHVFRLPVITSGQLVQAGDIGVDPTLFETAVPWDDGTLFDDGTGWEAEVGAFTVATALEGATVIVLDMAGMVEGLGHGHAIGILGRTYLVDDISYLGGGATITVTPPLRTDVDVGDFVTFRPRMYGTCVDAESFKSMFDLSGVIRPGTISFAEAIL